MSIPNYVRPQLTIKQLLDRTPSASVNRINAIVVGPQYLLSRYGKEVTPSSTFSASETLIPYTYTNVLGNTASLTNQVVDLDSVKLHVAGLEAVLATSMTGDVGVPNLSRPSVIKAATTSFAGFSLDASLNGRNTQIGDVLYITSNGATRRRVVTGLLGADSAATTLTNANTSLSSTNVSDFPGGVSNTTYPTGRTFTCVDATAFDIKENFNRGPHYAGKFGDKFTLTVMTGGKGADCYFKVTSASGMYGVASLRAGGAAGTAASTTITSAELGNLAFTIDTSGGALVVGQVFTFEVYANYTALVPAKLKYNGTYTGPKDTIFMVRVTGTNTNTGNATGATVVISDTAGVQAATTVVIGANDTYQTLSQYGLTFKITTPTSFLLTGETYYVAVSAAKASTTAFDKVILDGPAVDTSVYTVAGTALTTVKHVIPFSGEIPSTEAAASSAWVAADNGLTVKAGLSMHVTERTAGAQWVPFSDSKGTVTVSFRALVPPAYGESVLAIDQSTDINTYLGTIDIENDLAYAASQCLVGAQGLRIYALRVPADTAEGFNVAFRKVEATDMTYAFAIVSDKPEVKEAAKLHVLSMSTPSEKKFRRAYVGTDSPGEYVVMKYDAGDNLVTGALTGSPAVTLSIDPSALGIGFDALGLVSGDKVKILGGTYLVDQVNSDDVLTLQSGPANGQTSPAPTFEIWKANTPESQADYICSVSAGLGTRRVANVWCEDGLKVITSPSSSGTLHFIPSKFAAAEIAGLRSSVLPQQGLTRTEITSITEAPSMHTRYSQALLDKIAAAGTYVVTQDIESSTVFIRHQLTTETDKGSLYYEDSVGVNLDNVSFAVKDILEGYIGKYNVNPQTISEIHNRIFQRLTELTQTDIDTNIGPALIRFDKLVISADPILKDRINVSARLFLPLPLNNIEVVLQGSVDLTL